jgi:hypothetical protein
MLGCCGVFHGLALNAYKRTSTAPSDRAEGQYDALDTILLSVVTLEAQIGELPEIARVFTVRPSGEMTKRCKALVDALILIEEEKGPLTLKFQLAKFILTGTPYDTGVNPYQDFDLLVKLRNALIHPKPFVVRANESGSPADPVQRFKDQFRSRGVLADILTEPVQLPQPVFAPLLTLVSTRAAARWACNTACSIAHSLFEPTGGDEILGYMKQFSAGSIRPVADESEG